MVNFESEEPLVPSKTFGVVFAKSLVLSPEEFYGGFGDALQTLGYTTGSRIYMILRRPKLFVTRIESPASGLMSRFVGPRAGGYFRLHLKVREGLHRIEVPVLDLVWNMLPEQLKATYSRAELEKGVFAVRNRKHYSEIHTLVGPILGVELTIDDGGERVQFTLHQPNGGPMTLPTTIDRFLGASGQCLGIVGEVRYIGQTDDDDRHRLVKHEKLQQALAERRSDEQILVLIGRFNPTCVQLSEIGPRTFQISETAVSEIASRDKLTLIEMTLINYFKPDMNDVYKNGAGLQGSIVDRSLVAAGFDAVEIHYDPDNPLMFAGTAAAGFQKEHHICYTRSKLET